MRPIDTDAMTKRLNEFCNKNCPYTAKPSAQPKRKEGHWKLLRNGNAICSERGFTQVSAWDMDGWDNFCHHCGADMRGYHNDT